MNRKELALVATKLAQLANERNNNLEILNPPVSWRSALYHALIYSDQNELIEIIWQPQYSQFNISHQLRANLVTANNDNLSIVSLTGELENDSIIIKVSFQSNHQEEYIKTCTIGIRHFVENLWNGNQRSILVNQAEAELIFCLLKKSFLDENIPCFETNTSDHKFQALLDVINHLRNNHNVNNENDTYQSFLQTIVGAGLFYLPFGNEHFHGYISFKALQESVENDNNKTVKDHILPRKLAAKILFEEDTNNWNFNEFKNWYNKNMQFMLVTSDENRLLVNYYHDFLDYEAALANYGILKFPSNGSFDSPKEVRQFVNYLRETNQFPNSINHAMDMLVDFRNL
jgi:hypothetical protein